MGLVKEKIRVHFDTKTVGNKSKNEKKYGGGGEGGKKKEKKIRSQKKKVKHKTQKLAVDQAEHVVVHIVRPGASADELKHLQIVQLVPVINLFTTRRRDTRRAQQHSDNKKQHKRNNVFIVSQD